MAYSGRNSAIAPNSRWRENEILEQNVATVNVACDPVFLLNSRSAASELPVDQRIGSIGIGVSGKASELSVMRTEPIFAWRVEPRSLPSNKLSTYDAFNDPRQWGFSSFNGCDVTKYQGDQEAFENDLQFIGFSMGEVLAGVVGQPESGVAVDIAGSRSTYWLGPERVYAGEYFTIRPPLIDPNARKAQRSGIDFPPEYPENKIMGVYAPYRPGSAQQRLGRAIDLLFAPLPQNPTTEQILDRSDSISVARLYDQRHGIPLPTVRRQAIAFEELALVSAIGIIQVLQDYGIVTVNLANDTDPLTPITYAANQAIFGQSIDRVSEQQITPGRTGTYESRPLDTLSPQEQARHQKKRTSSLKFLSVALGLVDGSRYGLSPLPFVQEAALGAVFHHHLSNPQLAEGYDPTRGLDEQFAYIPGNNILAPPQPNPNTIEGQIVRSFHSAFSNAVASIEDMVARDREQIAGKALTNGINGQAFDYVRTT